MILKLRIFTLYKTQIRFIYSTTRRPSNKYVPTTWHRQPNCITYKFTNSNNRNSSRCTTLMNSAETRGKNRCHTRPIKSRKILNQPAWLTVWTMFWDLWSKSQIYADRNRKSINKPILYLSIKDKRDIRWLKASDGLLNQFMIP